MAKKTDVTITASGLKGTPIGAYITYQVGSIPTATVQLAPGPTGEGNVSGASSSFGNIDAEKRKQDIELSIKVKSTSIESGITSKTLKFVGLLDGLSVSNMVGHNTYSAVLKNKAQRLLELTTLTPGLTPTSVNIYKSTSMSMSVDAQKEQSEAVKAWGSLKLGVTKDINQKNPIKFWIELLRVIVKKQKSGWLEFTGTSQMVTQKVPFDAIFNDPRYQAALTEADKLLANIDMSAVDGGALKNAQASNQHISYALKNTFAGSPQVLLENLSSFLAEFGCDLIFGNTKIFIVPVNSVLEQENKTPGKKQTHNSPNAATPADYSSYVYSDNGYRDLGSVLVTLSKYAAGAFLGGKSTERGQLAHYVAPKEISAGSGIHVVETSPWMTFAHDSPQPNDSQKGVVKSDQKDQSMHPKLVKYDEAKSGSAEKHEEQAKKKLEAYSKEQRELLLNYGETIFYQKRYGDRQGSITMDFNPDWCPGTGGSLYIRESGMFINFYVTSVSHQIDTSAPSNGSALTIVNFCCGRMGPKPPGTKEYKFFGYNKGKEKGIQEAFIKDIT